MEEKATRFSPPVRKERPAPSKFKLLFLAAPGWLFGLAALLITTLPTNVMEGVGMMLGIIGIPVTILCGMVSLAMANRAWCYYKARVKSGAEAGPDPKVFLVTMNLPYILMILIVAGGFLFTVTSNFSPARQQQAESYSGN